MVRPVQLRKRFIPPPPFPHTPYNGYHSLTSFVEDEKEGEFCLQSRQRVYCDCQVRSSQWAGALMVFSILSTCVLNQTI